MRDEPLDRHQDRNDVGTNVLRKRRHEEITKEIRKLRRQRNEALSRERTQAVEAMERRIAHLEEEQRKIEREVAEKAWA